MAYMKPGIKHWEYYKCIDPEITELIILQHALGFQTISSCAGHQKGTSHRKEIAHIKKQCEEQGIEFNEDRHDNFYFHINYYIPNQEKMNELREIYCSTASKLECLVSPEKAEGFKLKEEKRSRGLRYAEMRVENHRIWENKDYAVLGQKLKEATEERIKDAKLKNNIKKAIQRT